MWWNHVFHHIFLCRSKNISQTRFHILGGWKSFQSLCLCGIADLTSSSEVHPEHLHPNCSCVNSMVHATGSCDTHIWYHYNEIMWVTRFCHYVVLAVSWPSDGDTFISAHTLRLLFCYNIVICSEVNNHLFHCHFLVFGCLFPLIQTGAFMIKVWKWHTSGVFPYLP